jgi:hypothetical protein
MRIVGFLFCFLSLLSAATAGNSGNDDSLKKAERSFERGLKLADKAWRKNSLKPIAKSRKSILAYRSFFTTRSSFHSALAKLAFLEGNELMAMAYLDSAAGLGLELSQADFFISARGLHLLSKWEASLNAYESFLRKPGLIGRRYVRNAEQGRSQVRFAIQLLQKPGRARIDSISMAAYNRGGREFSALTSADERLFIFVREPDSSMFKKGRLRSSDPVHCICIEAGQPSRLPDYLCKPGFLPVSLSPDGNRLILAGISRKGYSNLWVSDRYDGYFQRPQPFPEGINTAFNETKASFAGDNRSLFFVSDRPGGIGGADIYYSQLNEAGVWSTPRNLGPAINTPGNEYGVFAHPDGRLLYFSSDGHPGIGGADWFVARTTMGRFSDVQHLGIPINTPYDDKHLVMSGSSKFALLDGEIHEVSGRQDMRKVLLQGQEKMPMLADVIYPFALLNDIETISSSAEEQCFDCSALILLDLALAIPVSEQAAFSGGRVMIYDLALGQLFYDGFFGPGERTVHLVLPAGRGYGIVLAAEGYFPYFIEMNIPEGSPFRKDRIQVELTRPGKIASWDFPLVTFIDGSVSLPLSSRAGLQVLCQFMEDYPGVSIQLGIRSPRIQGLQSSERLDAVKRFLLDKGIAPSRIGEDLSPGLDANISFPHLFIEVKTR